MDEPDKEVPRHVQQLLDDIRRELDSMAPDTHEAVTQRVLDKLGELERHVEQAHFDTEASEPHWLYDVLQKVSVKLIVKALESSIFITPISASLGSLESNVNFPGTVSQRPSRESWYHFPA